MDIPADYTTLDAVRRSILQANLSGDTGDDPLLIQFIRGASAFISKRASRTFVPYIASYTFDYFKSTVLDVMPFDLLELTSFTNGDGSAINISNLVLTPRNLWPKFRIEIKPSSGAAFTFNSDWQAALTVVGWWGHHQNPQYMWVDTTEMILTGGITSTARLIDVTDPNGLDDDGRKRFEVRQYLKVGSEVMQVTEIVVTDHGASPDTYQLRVARGVLGTTKAAHLANDVIYRYGQESAIETICIRLCIWLYQHRDVSEGAIQLLNGALILEDKTLAQIVNEIDNFQKPIVMAP